MLVVKQQNGSRENESTMWKVRTRLELVLDTLTHGRH
jgi:hypothetical protein